MDGDELKRRRVALGLSQAELGKLLGVPQATISRWETGAHKIEHGPMLALALDRLGARRDGVESRELLRGQAADG